MSQSTNTSAVRQPRDRRNRFVRLHQPPPLTPLTDGTEVSCAEARMRIMMWSGPVCLVAVMSDDARSACIDITKRQALTTIRQVRRFGGRTITLSEIFGSLALGNTYPQRPRPPYDFEGMQMPAEERGAA